MAIRYDRGLLRPARRLDGRVVADAYFTRAGVFEYGDGRGGVVRELRDDADVFDPASLASAASMPVTNDHPPCGLLTPSNTRQYAVGATGDQVQRDDDHVRGTLVVFDGDVQSAMDAGKSQLSCGYTCDVRPGAGVHPRYGRYDRRQVNIRYNHLAVVDAGRAGPTVRARLDAADGDVLAMTLPNARARALIPGMDTEAALRALEAENAELKSKLAQADADAQSHAKRADAAEAELGHFEKRAKAAEAARADEKAVLEASAVKAERERADGLQKQVDQFDARFDAAVRDRAQLVAHGIVVLGPQTKLSHMSDREIRVEMIKRLDSSEDVSESRPDAGIEAICSRLYREHVEGAHAQARSLAVLDAAPADRPAAPSRPRHARGLEPLPSSKLRTTSK